MTAPPIVVDPVSSRVQSFLAAAQEFGILAEESFDFGGRIVLVYIDREPSVVHFDADGKTWCGGTGTYATSGIMVLSFVLALH